MVETINQKLAIMFKNPAQHTLIGIVKTSFEVDRLGDEEDILALASGEVMDNDEQITRSFKAWAKPFANQDKTHIMILEQNNME